MQPAQLRAYGRATILAWPRHHAKLVALRSGLKASLHAVLAKEGVRDAHRERLV
jgi:hypothetical protein